MGPTPQVNAKCDVVMKLSVSGTRTDTHTHKANTIQYTWMRWRAVISLMGDGPFDAGDEQ